MSERTAIEATAVHNRETFLLRVGSELVMIEDRDGKTVRKRQSAIILGLLPGSDTALTDGRGDWAREARFDQMTVTEWSDEE